MALSKGLVKVEHGDDHQFDFTQLATDRELRSAVPEWTHTAQSTFGPPMGRFGVAAILAALCSSLCLYSSSGSGDDFQYAARNRLDETFGTRALCSSFCRYGLLTRTSGTQCCRAISTGAGSFRTSQKRQCGSDCSQPAASRRIPSVSSSSISDSIAECVNRLVKTLYRELCSIRAQAFNSLHTGALLPLYCLCDSGRAAAMSCCDGQLGPARTLSELPRQHSFITGGYRSWGKTTLILNLWHCCAGHLFLFFFRCGFFAKSRTRRSRFFGGMSFKFWRRCCFL